MRFRDLAQVIAEAKRTSEEEFAARYPSVAFVLENFLPPPASHADSREWTETNTALPTLPGGTGTGKLFPHGQIFWVDANVRAGQHVLEIGRTAPADVILEHPRISRRHATIQKTEAGTWSIEHHGAEDGTMINGRPLHHGKNEPLEDGDVLLLGQIAILRVFFAPEALYRKLREALSM
ncbi:MAG TPA: FHA domain-containing protein [Planctomycetota bacterium]|nr:FHA domain-containing protein [Planctomycetota bacterium]